ncbi:MAG: hypothetical protein ACQKBW_08535 [Puniceicoccales bacterium]
MSEYRGTGQIKSERLSHAYWLHALMQESFVQQVPTLQVPSLLDLTFIATAVERRLGNGLQKDTVKVLTPDKNLVVGGRTWEKRSSVTIDTTERFV